MATGYFDKIPAINAGDEVLPHHKGLVHLVNTNIRSENDDVEPENRRLSSDGESQHALEVPATHTHLSFNF